MQDDVPGKVWEAGPLGRTAEVTPNASATREELELQFELTGAAIRSDIILKN